MAKPKKLLTSKEISPESQVARIQLSDLLLQKTDDLARADFERKKRRDQQAIELLGGHTTSLGAEKALTAAKRRPYKAYFSNDSLFFPEIYRTKGWSHLNPRTYRKPSEVGVLMVELIYNRFSQEVLPIVRGNNRRKGRGWAFKHSQFLSDAGIKELEQYREDAIEVMQTSSTYHEFRLKMLELYGVPYQAPLFD